MLTPIKRIIFQSLLPMSLRFVPRFPRVAHGPCNVWLRCWNDTVRASILLEHTLKIEGKALNKLTKKQKQQNWQKNSTHKIELPTPSLGSELKQELHQAWGHRRLLNKHLHGWMMSGSACYAAATGKSQVGVCICQDNTFLNSHFWHYRHVFQEKVVLKTFCQARSHPTPICSRRSSTSCDRRWLPGGRQKSILLTLCVSCNPLISNCFVGDLQKAFSLGVHPELCCCKLSFLSPFRWCCSNQALLSQVIVSSLPSRYQISSKVCRLKAVGLQEFFVKVRPYRLLACYAFTVDFEGRPGTLSSSASVLESFGARL